MSLVYGVIKPGAAAAKSLGLLQLETIKPTDVRSNAR
jgi:hypothetical protein